MDYLGPDNLDMDEARTNGNFVITPNMTDELRFRLLKRVAVGDRVEWGGWESTVTALPPETASNEFDDNVRDGVFRVKSSRWGHEYHVSLWYTNKNLGRSVLVRKEDA